MPLFALAGAQFNAGADEDGKATLYLDQRSFQVEVVCRKKELVQGLSGHPGLAADEGMLFVFQHSDRHGIWMKDMRFPIDILWIDRYGSVVHVEREVSPATFPKAFRPERPARYVLEVAAGASKGVRLHTGIRLSDVPMRCRSLDRQR